MKTLSTLFLALATATAAQGKYPADYVMADSAILIVTDPSEDNPLDATEYIKNPSFETNGTNGWTVSDMSSQTNSSFTKKSGNVYLEKWTSSGSVGNASVSQVVKGLPYGKYRLTVVPAEFVAYDREKMIKLGSVTTPQWPVAFAKLKVSPDKFINDYPCNHIHGVYGDYVDELKNVAKILDIPVEIFE